MALVFLWRVKKLIVPLYIVPLYSLERSNSAFSLMPL
jgi:hypothetical protein